GSTWMAYRPTHETECCAGNVNRMMPNFASRLWMRDARGAVVAAMYSPSEFDFTLDGDSCRVVEQTAYPFDGNIRFTFQMKKHKELPFTFRIPAWCASPAVFVNGKAWNESPLQAGTYVTMQREFTDGDVVEVQLPMQLQTRRIGNQGICFQRGPLLYAYPVPTRKVEDATVYSNMNGKVPGNEEFKCWSMTPSGVYNFGVDEELLRQTPPQVNVSEALLQGESYPYDLATAPVTITIPVREIRWSLEGGRYNPRTPEAGNALATAKTRSIQLVPYGCTELRLTVFPLTSEEDIPASSSESMLTNPDFELLSVSTYNSGGTERKTAVPYGWRTQGTLNGVSYGINHDANNLHGENVCWFRLLPFPSNFELYQVIPSRKLVAGRYRVRCRLWCEKGNKGTTRLFAGNNVQYFGSAEEYTNILTEGENATYANHVGGASPNFDLQEMSVEVDV
ncbi:MAG: glycoside hydrolase family 127 protein, partial [Bacteroidaceae bacterium]|nr:glycoside hydrolase family 127 protein [Bacteroidaceae bacterium]